MAEVDTELNTENARERDREREREREADGNTAHHLGATITTPVDWVL